MKAGFSEDDFWHKTPRQIQRALKGKAKQFDREHNDRAWLAHTTASLMRCDSKRFPKLQKLLIRDRAQVRNASTQDQQMALAKLINSVRGGKYVGRVH